jgi:gliding motility-associated-like protein
VDGKFIDSKDLNYVFNESGTKIINLIMKLGCLSTIFSDTVVVTNSIERFITASICQLQEYIFYADTINKAGIYTKSIQNGSGCDSLITLDLKIIPAEMETIDITCKKSVEKYGLKFETPGRTDISNLCLTISVVDSLCEVCLEVPNAFTPGNGDQTNNDFKPFLNCPNVLEKYKLWVYNRWGAKVFETSNIEKGWDGRYKNEDAPVDTYVYVITYIHPKIGKEEKLKGTVTLLR